MTCSVLLLAVAPYDFCTYTHNFRYPYDTNLTLNESDFYKPNYYRSHIWNINSVGEMCGKKTLDFTVNRTLKPQDKGYEVNYGITVSVKEIYRYNRTLLNDSLRSDVTACEHELHFLANESWLLPFLYLNISDDIIQTKIEKITGPGSHNCYPLQKHCPLGSDERTSTCGT